MDFSGCQADEDFGPAVQGCRDDFDFTLKFELIFLSILPAAIFIPLFLTSVAGLVGKPSIVRGAVFQWLKLVRYAMRYTP
jgi:ATP-binding cassette, subfamily C (CFTR/MRP), member 1